MGLTQLNPNGMHADIGPGEPLAKSMHLQEVETHPKTWGFTWDLARDIVLQSPDFAFTISISAEKGNMTSRFHWLLEETVERICIATPLYP